MSNPFKKTIITVSASASPLIQKDEYAKENTVLAAILRGKSVAHELVNLSLGGMSIKVDSAMNYARDSYTLGLPNNSVGVSGRLSNSVVATAIAADLGLADGCVVYVNMTTPLDSAAVLLPFLVNVRGCDLNSAVVETRPEGWSLPTTYSGRPVSTVVTVASVDLSADGTYIRIQYAAALSTAIGPVPTSAYTDTFYEDYTVDPAYVFGRPYLVASYSVLDAEGAASPEVLWWYYAVDSNEYPTLEEPLQAVAGSQSYPVIPIRYDNKFINATDNPDLHRTGSFLLQRLGVGMDSLQNTLAENPNISLIDHAYVMFGAEVNTDDVFVLRYLAEFFTYLSESAQQTVWDVMAGSLPRDSANSYASGLYRNTSGSTATNLSKAFTELAAPIEIRVKNPVDSVSLTEHGLDIRIQYSSITSVLVAGSIGEVGHATKEFKEGEYYQITTGSSENEHTSYVRKGGSLVLQHQVSTSHFRRVTVNNLVHTNYVYGRPITTSVNNLFDDPEEYNMVIPLHREVVRRFSRQDQDDMYAACMLLMILTYDKTTLKWYQSGIFAGIIMIAAVVVTAVSGQAWLVALANAAAIGVLAVLVLILETLVLTTVVKYAAAELTERLGVEWAAVIAVAAMLASRRFPGNFQFLGTTVPTSEAFMMLGSATFSGAQMGQAEMLQDVRDEQVAFIEDSEAQTALLEAKASELLPELSLPISYLESPWNYVAPDTSTVVGEFYDPIHIGNIGTLSLDVIENYVDLMLRLPEAKDTLPK